MVEGAANGETSLGDTSTTKILVTGGTGLVGHGIRQALDIPEYKREGVS